MDRTTFVDTFGDVYEQSPWVAERAYDAGLDRQHDTPQELHALLAATMLAAPRDLEAFGDALDLLVELARGIQRCRWELARPTVTRVRLDVELILSPPDSSRWP